MFICEIWLFHWYIPQSAILLICPSMDISKCFRGSLRLRDNKNRLYNEAVIYLNFGTSKNNEFSI